MKWSTKGFWVSVVRCGIRGLCQLDGRQILKVKNGKKYEKYESIKKYETMGLAVLLSK